MDCHWDIMPGAEESGGDPGAEMLKAAKGGDLQAVKLFLDEHKVSVDLQNSSGKSALMLTKDVSLAAMLLDRNAKVDLKDKKGKTAHALLKKGKAAQPCDKEMSALLISSGATDTDTVLLAAQRVDLEAVRRHLDLGVPVDAQGWSDMQKSLGRKDMLALLLGRGYSEDLAWLAHVPSAFLTLTLILTLTLTLTLILTLTLTLTLTLKESRTADDGPKYLDGDLAKDSLVLAVAAELDEEEFGNMVAGLVAPKLASAPHEAFNELVHWMEETDKRTRKLRSPDPRSADEHADLFVRLQLAAAALLENVTGKASVMILTTHTDEQVRQLLSNPKSVVAINTALRVSAKELFAQPVMQRYVEHVWIGEDLQYELRELSTSWIEVFTPEGLARRIWLVLLLLVNLLLLPVVALVPPLDKMLVAIDTVAREKAIKELKNIAEARSRAAFSPFFFRYLLRLPLVKFYLSFTAQLALALIFTLLPSATMHTTTAVSLLLLWMASGIVWEAKQAKDDVRKHFADYLNRYDIAALALSTATLLIAAATLQNWEADNPLREYWASTRALAILFLWLRTLRLLLVSPTFGPYALMFNRMLFNDVLYFIVLLSFLLVAIGAAWYALLESTTYGYIGHSKHGEPWREFSPAAVIEADGCADELGGIDLLTIIFSLLEGALTGSDLFDCARSSTEAPFASWMLSFFFVLLTVILLINMLIAMCGTCASNTRPHCAYNMPRLCWNRMSKTFDNIAEAASTNYLFLKAQMTISLAQEAPTPPPFYVLAFPTSAALWVWKFVARKEAALEAAAAPEPAATAAATRKSHKDKADPGKNTEKRFSLARIKRIAAALRRFASQHSRETLAKAVTEYVIDRQAEVAQEERWRTSMQRKMDQNNRSCRELIETANREMTTNQEQIMSNQKQNLTNQEQMKANQQSIETQLQELRNALLNNNQIVSTPV